MDWNWVQCCIASVVYLVAKCCLSFTTEVVVAIVTATRCCCYRSCVRRNAFAKEIFEMAKNVWCSIDRIVIWSVILNSVLFCQQRCHSLLPKCTTQYTLSGGYVDAINGCVHFVSISQTMRPMSDFIIKLFTHHSRSHRQLNARDTTHIRLTISHRIYLRMASDGYKSEICEMRMRHVPNESYKFVLVQDAITYYNWMWNDRSEFNVRNAICPWICV